MLFTSPDTLALSNLLRPEIRSNPYPFYAQLRALDPVHWDDEMGFWVLTRFDDIASIYADARFSRAQGLKRGYERLPQVERPAAESIYQFFSKTVFYSDPPYHTHLRGLVTSAFTPARVEHLRPFIQRSVDDLLDAAVTSGRMEVIRDFAYPLPVMVIAELLGLPPADRAQFKLWSDDLFSILGTLRHTPDQMQRAAQSLSELTEYIDSLSRIRRGNPEDDLLSALLAVTEVGNMQENHPAGPGRNTGRSRSASRQERVHILTQPELVANINILLSTGHETTTNLIGNGMLALIQNPDQQQLLREQPELMNSCVEEMLRYDNPVQITYRSATEDVLIGDKLIHAGDLVNSVLGAANRDPQRFSDPDRFFIQRDEGRHLSFGLGIHFCLGAPLVRLEAEIIFHSILRRFQHIHLVTEDLEWQEHPIFRGLKSLPIEVN